jgi:hypothetical protein
MALDEELPGLDIAGVAEGLLRDRLAKREALLDHGTWHGLVAAVVQDCMLWGFNAKKVVRLTEAVADRVLFIEEQECVWYRDFAAEWQYQRKWLLRDLGLLRRYQKPPAAAMPTEQAAESRPVGRPQNDEDLARDLLAGWKAFEPEEGRKTKDQYLAQRTDVRELKTADARQRKIASLRVALDSALHLRREKTKRKRPLR